MGRLDVVCGLLHSLDLISKHVVEMFASSIYYHKKLTVAQFSVMSYEFFY